MSDYDDEIPWEERPCNFCGSYECDRSGYNCPDNHYQEYNLRGWPE